MNKFIRKRRQIPYYLAYIILLIEYLISIIEYAHIIAIIVFILKFYSPYP